MKYCVYAHKTLDGKIFYIGHGTVLRANNLEKSKRAGKGSCRGKKYAEFVENIEYDYTVEILESNLTKEQAYDLEVLYYYKYKEHLINARQPFKEKIIDKETIKANLIYDPTSPTCLRWISRRQGLQAGGKNDKYYDVRVCDINYKAHRVVMVLHDVDITGLVVDHIDGNCFNNRFENLRVVTQEVNSQNRKPSLGRKSGVTRVKNTDGSYRWVAFWNIDSKQVRKYFAINKYGEELAYKLACDYRDFKIRELNAAGANYTELHTQ